MTSEEKFERLVTDARDCAWQQLMRNNLSCLYLYYVPSGPGRWGEVLISETTPEDALLASPERVSAHLDRDQLRRWIQERCSSLPLFPQDMPWITVPARGIPGNERFHRAISRDAWFELSRGKDLSPYRPVEHRRIYDAPASLGSWSGDHDSSGEYLDSCPQTCPF